MAASDRQRELTARGRNDIALGAQCFLAHCAAVGLGLPAEVLHSPWRRTMQTAARIASAISDGRRRELEALWPGSDIDRVDAALTVLAAKSAQSAEPNDEAHHLLVSHQPLVTRLIDYYLGQPGYVPALPPGGLAVLRMDTPAPACAELLFWMLPPAYEAAR